MFIKRIAIATAIMFATIIVAVAAFFSLAPQAEAQGQCHNVNAKMATVADFANFTTEGEIQSGILKGTTIFTGDPLSLTPITSTTSPPVEPLTFSYTGDLEITTDKGTLTTRGVGVFEGVPFGLGTQFDRVVGGTGEFDGAEGFLTFTFESDETGGAFESSVTGEICVN